MIKYIGSKRVLVDPIVEVVRSLPDVRSVVDYFSGTSRVGHALKRAGYQVHANDWMAYGPRIGAASPPRSLVDRISTYRTSRKRSLNFLCSITDRLTDASLGYFLAPLVSVSLGITILGEQVGRF